MIHWLLRNDGWPINLKRLYRLYRQEDLSVRRRRRRKRIAMDRPALSAPQRPDQVWSMDFVMDQLADGRRLKCLTVVDDCSKESIAVSVDTSIPGGAVARLLETVKSTRSLPQAIRTDHGPEFTGKALAQWAYQNGVALWFIQPGKPIQNAFVEAFNGRFYEGAFVKPPHTCLTARWNVSSVVHSSLPRHPHCAC